ncbi:MAG TPA: ABC transporter permease subunit [Vicinamibacterales bacterium]|nr:ABC transporter permease subunit [Vicinamibacterales bacterium]
MTVGRGSAVAGALAARNLVLVGIAAAALVSAWLLWMLPGSLRVSGGGLETARAFFARALAPAFTYEAVVPTGTTPLLWKAALAVRDTVTMAAAAMSLALAGGAVLGFCASSAWWSSAGTSGWRRALARMLWGATRSVMAVARAIHELLWAVLLLAAFGISEIAAILAIAIPYAAILGKVFAELVDEASPEPSQALREGGASALQAFLFGQLPRALPDMAAYAFYRFECAIRSSAILGFFGFPTLGYFIAASFENAHYGEVWTYLYALFALVAVLDWWSGALRRRFVA